eukprot:TRINITY_DN5044_c0_g2_i4.p1 TRINITY_DN5044_c0_g2~~TRINITY_DN5044_c0_g2_i4.p1  ORF type:complete len:204 (+),score=16.35 TRINITY_DN5044_c0_g2_i4:126-737(+)
MTARTPNLNKLQKISTEALTQLQQDIQDEFDSQSEENNVEPDQQRYLAQLDNQHSENIGQQDFEEKELQIKNEEQEEEEEDNYGGQAELSIQELNARRLAVFETLSGSQLDRYECYRRASFQKSKMTRVMRYILRQNVNERMIISMQGIAKLFVGELVECARKVANDRGDRGPLKPAHIHAAYQILYSEGKIPMVAEKRRPFL